MDFFLYSTLANGIPEIEREICRSMRGQTERTRRQALAVRPGRRWGAQIFGDRRVNGHALPVCARPASPPYSERPHVANSR